MKRVLVTGASGFIGRQSLSPLAKLGYEVHAVCGRTPVDEPSVLAWHQADLLAEGAAAALCAQVRPTHLLHFAWYAVPGLYWTSLENLRWSQASLTLVRAFRENGGERAALAGTCAEYDWTIPQESFSETASPVKPTALYGTAKHETRVAAERYAQEHDLSLAWGRIFFLYGPHEPAVRLVPSVVRALLAREPANCTSGEQIRDFLMVEDAGSAFAALLDSRLTGAVNIGSGSPQTVRDVVFTIADTLGVRDLVRLGVLPTKPGEPQRIVADTTRLRETGWMPRYDMTSGLRETIEWWKENRE